LSSEGKKVKNKRSWKEYNESLIKMGKIVFDIDFLSNWQAELVEMNRKKKGAKYRYPNSLLATVHVYLLPCRQLEGFLNVMSEHIPRLKEKVPDYTTMWWRVVKIKIALKPEINQKEKEGILTIVVDSTD
jgi:DDE family transposase